MAATGRGREEKAEWKKTFEKNEDGFLYDSYTEYTNLKPARRISSIRVYTHGPGVFFFEIARGNLLPIPDFDRLRTDIMSLGFTGTGSTIRFQIGRFVTAENPEKVQKALNLIEAIEKLDKETQQDIYRVLHIKTPEDVVRDEAIRLTKNHDISGAARLAIEAQKEGHFKVIAEVIEFLFSNATEKGAVPLATFEEINNLCKEVTKTNPFYPTAHHTIAHLILLKDEKSAPLDDEHSETTEAVLIHAIRSEDQALVAGMRSQLCDLPIGSFNNAQGDNATLIVALAKQVRDLRKENAKLVKQMDQQKKGTPSTERVTTPSATGGLFGNTDERPAAPPASPIPTKRS